MLSKDNKVALLVHGCDRYELLFKGFDYFFTKYWDSQINCNFFLQQKKKKL
jgi:hypothetical protein